MIAMSLPVAALAQASVAVQLDCALQPRRWQRSKSEVPVWFSNARGGVAGRDPEAQSRSGVCPRDHPIADSPF
jgi:hypothetical protein